MTQLKRHYLIILIIVSAIFAMIAITLAVVYPTWAPVITRLTELIRVVT